MLKQFYDVKQNNFQSESENLKNIILRTFTQCGVPPYELMVTILLTSY
jgi:hypothetical protein